MVNQWTLKLLLLPLAILYGLGVAILNGLYAIGLLRGVTFSIPVISIGNLTVGGTGKTPHTEYLIRLLHEYLPLAVVSRGYKRKTTGYLEVAPNHDASQSGDEPLQYKRKYPHVPVAVAESRSFAIPQVIRNYPYTKVILLDDGYQHREVVPGLNILLTEFNRLYTRDWLLPVGRLREWRSGAGRADIIVVTKCPDNISTTEMESIRAEVTKRADQHVFFSRYRYGLPYKMYGSGERLAFHKDLDVLLVVAIAGTEYLLEYVDSQCGDVRMLEYNDHHPFSNFDIGDIERHFKLLPEGRERIILTTEKDAMRLDSHRALLRQLGLPIYILPVAVQFIGEDSVTFDDTIKEWLLNFKL
jgi:tetraacyldisaccharide 4'-kinase